MASLVLFSLSCSPANFAIPSSPVIYSASSGPTSPKMTSVNEQTPLLDPREQYTPQSIEDDPHTAAILRQSSRVLSEIDEDFPPGAYLFTEVVQSPFAWFSDEGVFAVRVALAVVMTAMQGVYWWLEYQRGGGSIFWFRFGNLVWAAQCCYMWLVSVSCFLLHKSKVPISATNTPIQIWSFVCISAEFNLPYMLNRRRRRRRRPYRHSHLLFTLAHSTTLTFLFRTLYTLVTTLPFATTLFYFLILLPNPQTPAYPAVLPELIINIASSVIALFEIFVLASVTPVPGRTHTHHIEQCVVVVLVVVGYCTLGMRLWERVNGAVPGERTDWRLLGGWRKEREVVAIEVACVIAAYFYAVVEFMHCCKYFCFLD